MENIKVSTDKTHELATGKKPYKAPSFRFQRVFETSGLGCAKIYRPQSSRLDSRREDDNHKW